MLIHNLERAARIFGHGDAGAREDAIRRRFWDLDAER